ncbi:hypothetical protein GRI99_18230, partial [Altererythrobacter buctensis]|nr:hypothetical protein [Alteraurantiacibacter buctensis]
PNWLKNIGRMMMSGLLLAINPMALATRLLQVARNGVNAFKDYLGIRSPSRLFMALGGHTVEGFARGIAGGQQRPAAAMTRLARGVAAAGALGMAGGAGGLATASAAVPSRPAMAVTINVYQQPGQDGAQLAREIRRELHRLDGVAQRSSYQED